MQVNIQQIDEFLNPRKKTIRQATDKDIIFVKNELLLLLNLKYKTEEGALIRKLINEIQYLRVNVEKDDAGQMILYYEPPLSLHKRVTIDDSGWITIEK